MEGRKFASKIDYFCADIIILTYRKHSSINGFRVWVNAPLWGERVTEAKSYTRRFKILIFSINHKGKILFLCMYISVMENNEISEKIEMDLFDLENPYISYGL